MSGSEKPRGYTLVRFRSMRRILSLCAFAQRKVDFALWRPLITRLARDCNLNSRDLLTLTSRLATEGIRFLTVALPSLGKSLDRGLGDGVFELPSSFKKAKGRATPAFAGELFSSVFDDDGRLLQDASEIAIADLRQFLFFAYKCDLPYKEKANKAVVEKFVENEVKLSSLNIRNDALLEVASLLAAEVFQDFDPGAIVPRHGPGVTARFGGSARKYSERLTPGMPVYRDFGHLFWFNHQDGFDRLERYPVWKHHDHFRDDNVAKVLLVPKDSRGPRLISAEPVENQWIQQGLMSYMVKTLERHPLTRGQVNFTDQSVNQRLALEHSKSTGSFSTLDLKDASDLNSLQLTKYVFGRTKLLSSLIQSRSTKTRLPDGTEVRLRKFAPMGSAVCFPVMASSIFFLIVAGLLGLGIALTEACASVYVYGDDIVIRNEHAHFAIDILHRYGFKVNTDKSFINSRFLESCGWDCFNGYVVTPTRLRKDHTKVMFKDPSAIASLASTANQLSTKGYKRSAKYCYFLLEQSLGPLPYGTERSPYVCRTTIPGHVPELNFYRKGLVWRKESNLQRYPLGSSLVAWKISTLREHEEEVSGWAHLMRTHSMLGTDSPVPQIGTFDRSRTPVLKRAKFDHYSMD